MIIDFFKRLICKIKKNEITSTVGKWLFYLSLRLLFATYRLRVVYDPTIIQPLQKQKGVFYFWHQNILSGMCFFFKQKAHGACVVSPSNDGKFAGFICQKLGFDVLYGSANKSPIQLLRQSLYVLNKSMQMCLVGDGSRGPAFILQPGISYLAGKAQVPIIFVDCKASWSFTFKKSWDQFKIPLPFSKIVVHLKNQGVPTVDR
jgi:hypothetical protein